MKNIIIFTSFAALLGVTIAAAQEKSASETAGLVSFVAQPAAYSPADMKVMGTLDNGETSKPVVFSNVPKYRAYVFEGNGHDQVQITVTGTRNAYVALADSTLLPIASGLGRLNVTLPYHGPDTESFYILVKNLSNPAARVAVHLKKIPASAPVPDATH